MSISLPIAINYVQHDREQGTLKTRKCLLIPRASASAMLITRHMNVAIKQISLFLKLSRALGNGQA